MIFCSPWRRRFRTASTAEKVLIIAFRDTKRVTAE
jgi:hypothetical protein